MQAYDIAMLVVLLGTAAWGFMKGLAWQLASIASFVVSYFVAMALKGTVAPLLPGEPPLNNVLAMLILFVVTSLAVWVGFRFVSETIEKVKLKEFDRQIGALFGLAKGVLYCVAITLFAATLLTEQREAIVGSRSGYYISHLLTKADPLLPEGVKEAIEPYVAKLDGAETSAPPASLPEQLTKELFDATEKKFTEKLDRFRGQVQSAVDDAQGEVQNAMDDTGTQVRSKVQQSFPPSMSEDEEDLDMVDVAPARPSGRR